MSARRWHSREARELCAATGAPDPAAAITQLAEGLLDEAGLEGPPVDLLMLASFQGIREIRQVAMHGAARLIPNGTGLMIEVNREHSLGRQRFSCAHEIVHTLLPTYSGGRIDDAETGRFDASLAASEEELLCDIGASALLLDARWLRPLARAAGPSLQTLFDLAAQFETSLQATAWKLAALDLWPCAFVFWEYSYRKAERIPVGQAMLPTFEGRLCAKLRVTRVYSTASFGYFIPHNKSVSATSAVAACCDTDQPTAAIEDFDLGHISARLYCENVHVPYHVGDSLRQRVISFLMPPESG